MGLINGAEVAKHDNKKSCWIVLDSKAYDVTDFLFEHPGGAPIILRNAGTVSLVWLNEVSSSLTFVSRMPQRNSRNIIHWTTSKTISLPAHC